MNTAARIGIAVVIVLALGGLVWWVQTGRNGTAAPQYPLAETLSSTSTPGNVVSPSAEAPETHPAPPTQFADVRIQDMKFSPASLTVKKGTKVSWTNEDTIEHTVVGDAKDSGISSVNLSKNSAYSYVFNDAGTFSYHCGIHPSMKGTVIVTE